MIEKDEFRLLATITGFRHYPNVRKLFKGDRVTLVREYQNEHDPYAIAVFLPEGQIGYIANSKDTVRENTKSAAELSELIGDFAKAEILEGGYHDAVCKLKGIFDVDKMTLKAFSLYDECQYEEALELFLRLREKYDSVMLLQYTADCLIKLSKFKDALTHLKIALKKETENNITLMMYATAQENLGNFKEAESGYLKILENKETKEAREALKRCKAKR